MNTREQFTPELWEYVENAVANGEVQIVENKAHIQKGSDLIEQGVTEIYNNLEDAHEPVKADGYVITGTAGEQWCIKEKNLPKYGVTADEIPPEGMDVMTQPDGRNAGSSRNRLGFPETQCSGNAGRTAYSAR